jgi:hypothetical protein
MPTVYIPKISAHDYEPFRRMLSANFPNTYDEWLKFADNEINRISAKGDIAAFMEVRPDEFARYCAAERTHCDFDSLKAFALQKASGYKY